MILKSSIDRNIYRFKTLSNGLRLVLVSNPVFKTASCAVSVQVGSYNEPTDFPGIAHFLEHMLFLGTEAYPSENTLDEFVSIHNGYSNAYTSSETTVYHCCAKSDHLKELNSIFANFFIQPIFNKDSVEREIEAVNSEYLNALNFPDFRYEALLKEFMHKGIPESIFTIGNTETLKHDNIRERVMKFWEETYTSNEMVAVIVGSDSIEQLEEYGQIYSKVPMRKCMDEFNTLSIRRKAGIEDINISSASTRILNVKSIFDPIFYQKLVHMKSLEDNSELRITFITPPILTMFKKNPIGFIESVLTSNEKGSLLSDLKKKRLGFGVSLEYAENCEFTLITIIVSLTNQINYGYINDTQSIDNNRNIESTIHDGTYNFLNTDSIVCSNISYILSLILFHLNNLNICEDEYNRIKNLSSDNFKFVPNEAPVDLSSSIAYSLQWYPQEYVLFHNYSYEEYDYEMISTILNYFKNYKEWIVVFVSSETYLDISIEGHKSSGCETRVNEDGMVCNAMENVIDHKTNVLCNSKTTYFNKNERYFKVKYKIHESILYIDHNNHSFDRKNYPGIDYKNESRGNEILTNVLTLYEARANIDCSLTPMASNPSDAVVLKDADHNEVVMLNNVEILPLFRRFDCGSIYYLFTDSFSTPHSEVYVILKSDVFFEIEYSIFVKMVYNVFAEKYDRLLKNYHLCISVVVVTGAIQVHASGFSNKMVKMIEIFINEAQELYESIINDMHDSITTPCLTKYLFEMAKDELIDESNSRISRSPSSRLLEVLKNTCTRGLITTEHALEKLKDIKYETMKSKFISTENRLAECSNASHSPWSNYFVDIISVGNMLYSDVLQLFKNISDKHFVSMPPDVKYSFDQNEICFYTKDKINNAILIGFRAYENSNKIDLVDPSKCEVSTSVQEDNPLQSIAISKLIGQICSESFFNELRTKETLGYIVSAYTKAYLGNDWIFFIVQSIKSIEFLKNRVKQFLETFLYEKDCDNSEEMEELNGKFKDRDASMESRNNKFGNNSLSTSKDEDDSKNSNLNVSENNNANRFISLDLYKSSLVSFYREPFANIKDLGDFILNQYLNKKIDLDYIRNICDEIEKIEIKDILSNKIFERRIVVRSEKNN